MFSFECHQTGKLPSSHWLRGLLSISTPVKSTGNLKSNQVYLDLCHVTATLPFTYTIWNETPSNFIIKIFKKFVTYDISCFLYKDIDYVLMDHLTWNITIPVIQFAQKFLLSYIVLWKGVVWGVGWWWLLLGNRKILLQHIHIFATNIIILLLHFCIHKFQGFHFN